MLLTRTVATPSLPPSRLHADANKGIESPGPGSYALATTLHNAGAGKFGPPSPSKANKHQVGQAPHFSPSRTNPRRCRRELGLGRVVDMSGVGTSGRVSRAGATAPSRAGTTHPDAASPMNVRARACC